MRSDIKLSWLMVLMMVISACVRPQEKLPKDIESAEKEIAVATDAVPSFERADSLVKMYLNYADQDRKSVV